MHNKNKYWLIILLLLFMGEVKSQKVQFTVDAPAKVELGGQFRLTYSINQDADFTGPEFNDFQLLGGPSTSSSTSMQIINGRTSSTTKKSYTYYVKAIKLGKLKLPIATVSVNEKVYKSAPISIEVVKNASNPNATSIANNNTIKNTKFKTNGVVFVKSFVSKRNIYIGEPVILTQKLYSKERLANITDFKEPSYTGFWKEGIDIGELKLTKEVVNGKSYNVVILNKSVLFPQKSGKLEIGSFKLDAIIQIIKKRKARDHFEQMMYGNVIQYYANETVKLNSPKITITVNALPTNKPKGFTGVVGKFNMKAEIDKTELKANDAFNLKVTIKGNGNIGLLEAPKINFPPDFEVYDPKVSKKSKKTTTGVNGSKTYEYLIIPRNEGDFTIPSFGFYYFNPQTEHYESSTSPEFKIHVTKGEGIIFNGAASSSVNRDEIKYLGKDIRYISTIIGTTSEIDSHGFNSLKHILSLISIFILSILLIIYLKKQEKKKGNTSLMRLKKATKMAKKRLKIASKFLNENDEAKFYEETSKAIWGYLSDKFNINLSELSMDIIKGKLMENNVDINDITEISQILEQCEYARYAPTRNQHDMLELYDKSVKIISKIEKTLK
ncbi:MAG: hypothetical protein DRI86_10310 [Bacteroidetes bacterium]|nr:MAG: hypothetical protein DRI86_10310 [Bacteroidota bacterium]